MKFNAILFIVCLISLLGCKPSGDSEIIKADNAKPSLIPPTFQKCLDYHQNQNWKEVKGLEFTTLKSNGNEHHIIDLDSRFTCVIADSFSIVKNEEGCFVSPSLKAFDGNPLFYHNVYFYFVAMPHVLADPGIKYETLGDFILNDTIFHGIKMSYDKGIGDADKDEYIVLVDKGSFQMKYLLYTVTYFTDERSNRWSVKRYDDWTTIKGISLPTQITSYSYEDHKLYDLRNTVFIKDIEVSFDKLPSFKFNANEPAEKFIPNLN